MKKKKKKKKKKRVSITYVCMYVWRGKGIVCTGVFTLQATLTFFAVGLSSRGAGKIP